MRPSWRMTALRRHRGTARRRLGARSARASTGQARTSCAPAPGERLSKAKLRWSFPRHNRVKAWSSIEASSRHAACRQAFGLSGRQGGLIAPQPIQLHASALCPSPAFPAGREAPLGAAMGARNKVGRLSHGRTDREWSCATADPDRPRLDGQISSAAAALANLNVKTAYIDGELCGVDDAGLPSFAHTKTATEDERDANSLLRLRPPAF